MLPEQLVADLMRHVDFLRRWAVQLLAACLDKILAALGPGAQEEAHKYVAVWVGGWLLDKGSGTAVRDMLDRLYEAARIRKDVENMLESSLVNLEPSAYDMVADRLENLDSRFGKQSAVAGLVVGGLSRMKPWIIAAYPQGAPAVYGVLLAGVGGAVYLGGDYLDWYRTEHYKRLDFVPGVRSVVKEGLFPPDADLPWLPEDITDEQRRKAIEEFIRQHLAERDREEE